MFTGLITDVGRLTKVEGTDTRRMQIETSYDTHTVELGASIACNGVCLTVVDKGEGTLCFDVSEETLDVTTLANWRPGMLINLERSLKLGDEMGGHIVSGHVDCVGRLVLHRSQGATNDYTFAAPTEYAHLLVKKGSICVNGVSLTVNEVTDGGGEDVRFDVTIIPHTLEHTSFKDLKENDVVNLEFDLLARYVARIQELS